MFNQIIDKIKGVFNLIFSGFLEVKNALNDFYLTLVDLKDLILDMVIDPSSGSGLPVIESIGLVRYLVGDVIFHLIYIVILVGCLFTIFKLVSFLFDAYDWIFGRVGGPDSLGELLKSIIQIN